MENRFDNNSQLPEEQNSWGAYATPPAIPGRSNSVGKQSNVPHLPQDVTMCDRVQERLPFLLENEDGEIPADTLRAIYGHLSICQHCSKEFDEQQRVVSMLEAMPAVEMPMDFSGVIARRITMTALSNEAVVSPGIGTRAFGTPVAATAAAAEKISHRSLSNQGASVSKTINTSLKQTHTVAVSQLKTMNSSVLQRLTAGTVISAVMAFFVSSNWGREMLGANITAVRAWLDSVGAALSRIPVLGRLALLVFTALAQIGDLLGNTYRTVGDMAVRGMAMDVGVCLAAYYFIVVRRQRDASWIRRA